MSRKDDTFGFYKVNTNYLKYLNSIDSEVYYDKKYESNMKPFVGIIIPIENASTYFIPLSSIKAKHKKWKLKSNKHLFAYEKIKSSSENPIEQIKLLGLIDIKKMIPVPNGLYERIDFNKIR